MIVSFTPQAPSFTTTRNPATPDALAGAEAFRSALQAAATGDETPRLSRHAEQRLADRGIALGPAEFARMNAAMQDLAEKGARQSLLLLDSVALVVNVPQRTVITGMPMAEAGTNIFTNIDSAMVAPAAPSSSID